VAKSFLSHRTTNGGAYTTMLRPTVCRLWRMYYG